MNGSVAVLWQHWCDTFGGGEGVEIVIAPGVA